LEAKGRRSSVDQASGCVHPDLEGLGHNKESEVQYSVVYNI